MGGVGGGGGMREWMVWEVMYIDGATFDVSLHRGVGAMEIVAMDMKVSCHGYEVSWHYQTYENQSSTKVPSSVMLLSVSCASSEGCMQPASSALLV